MYLINITLLPEQHQGLHRITLLMGMESNKTTESENTSEKMQYECPKVLYDFVFPHSHKP